MERDNSTLFFSVKYTISTHTLTWSVTLTAEATALYFIFQLTRSRGAWQAVQHRLNHSDPFQLTRSRGAWHALGAGRLKHMVISTHTLTWSVTTGKRRRISITGISTHTLTWSVTGLPYSENAGKHISTHTLTWSVTQGDLKLFTYGEFQLTRSRGAWPMNIYQLANFICHFNSHAHVERDDFKIRIISATVAISTHTLTWSVTFPSSSMPLSQNDFNSHAHVERDLSGVINDIHRYQFQLTRSRGAWRVCKASADLSRIISTHTLTWSVTYARTFCQSA